MVPAQSRHGPSMVPAWSQYSRTYSIVPTPFCSTQKSAQWWETSELDTEVSSVVGDLGPLFQQLLATLQKTSLSRDLAVKEEICVSPEWLLRYDSDTDNEEVVREDDDVKVVGRDTIGIRSEVCEADVKEAIPEATGKEPIGIRVRVIDDDADSSMFLSETESLAMFVSPNDTMEDIVRDVAWEVNSARFQRGASPASPCTYSPQLTALRIEGEPDFLDLEDDGAETKTVGQRGWSKGMVLVARMA